MKQASPCPINHVALSVPNLEEAIMWYSQVFGMKQLGQIMVPDRSVSPELPVFKVYPSTLTKMRVVFMSAGPGAALELFEFKEPKPTGGQERYSFARDFNRAGLFHMAFTTPHVDELCEKVVKFGGKRIGPTMPAFGYKTCCVEDKWGNVLELMDFTFEQFVTELDSAQNDLTKQAHASHRTAS